MRAGGFNMPMDEEKKLSKGFAFVEFHTPEVRLPL
jgi:RNA recognition motif-containing protein